MTKLSKGLYERLIYEDEIAEINRLIVEGRASVQTPSFIENREYLLAELMKRLPELLDEISSSKDNNLEKAQAELKLISALLKNARFESKAELESDFIADPPQIIRSIHEPNMPGIFPVTGLRTPWLFSSSRCEPSLLHELIAELQAVDRVDILVSFITWSGVRKIIDVLKQATAIDAAGKSRTKFRVLTTTYIGATDAKAVNALAELPNVELKISLDGRRTRLHAKAWIFNRNSGFGTAFIGSANLSESALISGIEWTVKLTQISNEPIFKNAQAHFETLWNDGEFLHYDPGNQDHRIALEKALHAESRRDNSNQNSSELIAIQTWFDLNPKPYQQEMLDRLAAERSHHRYRNLVVAATGTGKTVVAAFDYTRLAKEQGGQPRLLFVAHRVQILKQAINTFRQVLRDSNFGELLDGNNEANQHDHLFATINTVHNRDLVGQHGEDFWNMVIIDEAHHLPASTFDRFISSVKPAILLGLTATPERVDGKSLNQYFDARPDGTPAVTLRLWDALDQELLAPFEYYATHDNIDLTNIQWKQINVDVQLDNIISVSDIRARSALQAVETYVSSLEKLKAIGFCISVRHAEFMAEYFNSHGLPSKSITGQHNQAERDQAINELKHGKLNVIFTCDLFNEGIDIPGINTLLLLRPTQSPVVFQQQIGRGLRLSPDKCSCLVLDFIGTYSQDFRFDVLLRSLTGQSRMAIKDSVDKGFGLLPTGCHIQFDRVARERVLESLKFALNLNVNRLTAELVAWANAKDKTQIKLKDFLIENEIELTDIYSANHYWSEFKRRAQIPTNSKGPREDALSRRLASILYVDDVEMLNAWHQALLHKIIDVTRTQVLAHKFLVSPTELTNPAQFMSLMDQHPAIREELIEVIEWRLEQTVLPYLRLQGTPSSWLLSLHNRYSRSDIITAIGYADATKRPAFREGCLPILECKIELMFVTLDKSEGFAERVQYHDYAISPKLFHWQSQNAASVTNKTGRRYLDSVAGPNANGWRFYLFVRENKDSAYAALGEALLIKAEGEWPISITCELKNAMPVELFRHFSILRTA
jgi:superfamily II DNA or RNA helicase/HKD family nuclease